MTDLIAYVLVWLAVGAFFNWAANRRRKRTPEELKELLEKIREQERK